MRAETINRLIDIKRDELHRLRLDVEQLEQLVEQSRIEHERTVQDHMEWMESIRTMEIGNRLASALDMKEARDFLTHLHGKSKHTEQGLAEVTRQRDSARKTLQQMFIEKKTYELIDERNRSAIRKELLRRQQKTADDEELIRIVRSNRLDAEC